jgi:hypothetical protein
MSFLGFVNEGLERLCDLIGVRRHPLPFTPFADLYEEDENERAQRMRRAVFAALAELERPAWPEQSSTPRAEPPPAPAAWPAQLRAFRRRAAGALPHQPSGCRHHAALPSARL